MKWNGPNSIKRDISLLCCPFARFLLFCLAGQKEKTILYTESFLGPTRMSHVIVMMLLIFVYSAFNKTQYPLELQWVF